MYFKLSLIEKFFIGFIFVFVVYTIILLIKGLLYIKNYGQSPPTNYYLLGFVIILFGILLFLFDYCKPN